MSIADQVASLTAHVRRLEKDDVHLYIRFDQAALDRIGLRHGARVQVDLNGRARVTGLVKTSGATPWLAPGGDDSNASITQMLRGAGFRHGDDVPSRI